jgi:adenosylhomocysteine nucleosidase
LCALSLDDEGESGLVKYMSLARRLHAILLIAIGLAGCISATSHAEVISRDGLPRIAVVSAFPPEYQTLKTHLEQSKTVSIGGVTFSTGELEGRRVVLFLSGMSMVNAAMSTQNAIDHFNIKAIVFSGIAGGVNPARHVGDVVVPEQWGQYLESVFARENQGSYQMPPLHAASLPNFQMIFPQPVQVVGADGGSTERRTWFPADADLLAVARTLAPTQSLRTCATSTACLSVQPTVIVGGNGISGPAFVDNAAYRTYLRSTFRAEVVDMESAAIAQVAYINSTRFIVFRSLSDLAGGGNGQNEVGTFLRLASENAASVVLKFVQALPASLLK